jgi:la-related protein 1
MDVLYQFWSHFLSLNHNTQMYNEFRHFALEDSTSKFTDVGLSSLIMFYSKTLLSTQGLPRYHVTRHYVELVEAETGSLRPAFEQLQSALRNNSMSSCKRQLIVDLLDDQY